MANGTDPTSGVPLDVQQQLSAVSPWKFGDPRFNEYYQTFQNLYKNMTGQDPTPDVTSQFITQAAVPLASTSGWNPSYGGISNAATAFIQNTFPQQVQQQQQKNQIQSLQGIEPQVQNLISQGVNAQSQNLMDPNSPTYQTFAGLMNKLGITPSSGAFQAGLGGTLGQQAGNLMGPALESVGLPALSGAQGASSAPYNQMLGQIPSTLQNQMDVSQQMQNFGMQEQLAKQLSDASQPSGFQTALGEAGAATGAFKNLMGGIQSARGTWICTELYSRGFLTKEEVKKIHDHLFRAFWKKPLKFIQYFFLGKFVVLLANKSGTHWSVWKPEFYDRIMQESDPVKAVDLYEEAFWNLYRNVRRNLGVVYG